MGWPNVVNTTYLVDPTLQYRVLELHFGFRDEGVNSYRSEKEITIVFPSTSLTAINGLIGAINTAVGEDIIEELE